MNWTKTSERLPDHLELILFNDPLDASILLGHYNNQDARFYEETFNGVGLSLVKNEVAHWCKVTKPPKE